MGSRFGVRCQAVARAAQRSFSSRTKLLESYRSQVDAGKLEKDNLQQRVVGFLADSLDKALQRPAPEETKQPGFAGRPGWILPQETVGISSSAAAEHRLAAEWTAKLAAENRRKLQGGSETKVLPAATVAETKESGAEEKSQVEVPNLSMKSSVYLHGPVGTGKTMLMNLFDEHSREAGLRTSRQHFYEFMISLHQQIHQIQEERPVEVAANSLSDDLDVLCFDEFQITDIQDAAILTRLFEILFLRGVTVVMTSNTSPQLLYSGGLNRHVHLPAFVRLVGEHCTVLGLGAKSVDYRRKAEAEELKSSDLLDSFLVGEEGDQELESRWQEWLKQAGPEEEVFVELPMGRRFLIRRASGSACFLDFDELCGGDRGEADFMALAQRFQSIFLRGVPRFTSLEDTDVVRRFVKFLDLLYDRRRQLQISCAASLEELFEEIRQEVKGDMGELAWRTAMYSADGKAGLSPQAVGTLCEAVRASERAESRLREMRTRRYSESCCP